MLRLAALALAGVVGLTAQTAQDSPVESPTATADALWATGRFDEAEAIYARELALDPASSRARFGVARALAMQSRLEDALQELSVASAAQPEDTQVAILQGEIYERQFRFTEAAAAFETAVALAPPAPAFRARAVRSHISLLRSFGNREPAKVEPDPDGSYTVPFRLVVNKIVMKARINGTQVDMVLDTGSERIMVTEGTARRAGLRTLGTTLAAGVGEPGLVGLGIGVADRIELGGMRIRNVPLSIRGVSRFVTGQRTWQDEKFSPVPLGLSAVIDYQNQRVTFARQLPDSDGGVRLPLRIYRLPFVRGVLNASVPAYFVVDTGGEVISISADTATELQMRPPRHIPLRVRGLSGLDPDAFLLPGVNVEFEAIAYRNFGLPVLNLGAPSALLGFRVGGIVGHRFLSGHQVAIDLVRSELRLTSQK